MAGQTTPTTSARSHAEEGGDRLGFYRLLASFPSLSSYRAKFYAVVAAGAFLPAFLLVLVLVLGAGRVGPLALIVLVVVLAAIATFAVCRSIDRLLVPLDLAEEAVDDVAFDRGVKRTELPGSDTAAQVLRGVQGLAKRVERDLRDARVKGERDELTGLYRRSVGRERAQQLIDRETHKGRPVRVVVADVIGFRAFNEAQGSGHGDAMLKAIAARLQRVAGDDPVGRRRLHAGAGGWRGRAAGGRGTARPADRREGLGGAAASCAGEYPDPDARLVRRAGAAGGGGARDSAGARLVAGVIVRPVARVRPARTTQRLSGGGAGDA
jgi:hypothetical protein